MITRRKFLAGASISPARATAASKTFRVATSAPAKIVILGAGFSGLAAAYLLSKQGVDATLLEARPQIGGRAFSHTIDTRSRLLKQVNYHWGNDDYSRGSYAIYGTGQWFTIRPILRASLRTFTSLVNTSLIGRALWKELSRLVRLRLNNFELVGYFTNLEK